MKKSYKILIIVAVVLIGLSFLKDMIIKAVIVNVGSDLAGARLDVGSFSSNFFAQKIRIKNIKLYNPPGFSKEYLIDIPEVGMDFDLGAFVSGKLHLPLIVLNVNEMVIVKNEKGELNVDSLKVVKEAKQSKKAGSPDEKKSKPQKDIAMQIDLLKLNLNQVVYKDFSQGQQPVVQVYPVDLKNKTFENITSPQQLVTLILMQGMQKTAIKGAAIYAAAAMTGVGLIPAGIIGALTGQDEVTAEFQTNFNRVYDITLKTINAMGDVKIDNKSGGVIKAKVNGADVTINFSEKSKNLVHVSVSARQFMLPKPEIAGGVIYKMKEALK